MVVVFHYVWVIYVTNFLVAAYRFNVLVVNVGSVWDSGRQGDKKAKNKTLSEKALPEKKKQEERINGDASFVFVYEQECIDVVVAVVALLLIYFKVRSQVLLIF